MINSILLACVINADINTIKLVEGIAKKNKVPADLVHAVIQQESRYQKNAINNNAPIASYGLGQLTINTAKDKCGLRKEDIMDPIKNIECATKFIGWQLRRYNGDEWKAISAYNNGSFTNKNRGYTSSVFMKMINMPKNGCF